MFIEKLKNVNIKEGSRLEMKVRATGNPNPDIVWLKNSDIIVPHKYPKIRYVCLKRIKLSSLYKFSNQGSNNFFCIDFFSLFLELKEPRERLPLKLTPLSARILPGILQLLLIRLAETLQDAK